VRAKKCVLLCGWRCVVVVGGGVCMWRCVCVGGGVCGWWCVWVAVRVRGWRCVWVAVRVRVWWCVWVAVRVCVGGVGLHASASEMAEAVSYRTTGTRFALNSAWPPWPAVAARTR
jgi:hypothetical protein